MANANGSLPHLNGETARQRARRVIREEINSRAARYRRFPPLWWVMWPFVAIVMRYFRILRWLTELQDVPGTGPMVWTYETMRLDADVRGQEHIPTQEPALYLANHPTGLFDGVVMWNVIEKVRPGTMVFANQSCHNLTPEFANTIIPVYWDREKFSFEVTKETTRCLRRALQNGSSIVVFPAGRIAKFGYPHVHDHPWKKDFVKFGRRLNLKVVPVTIRARNSLLFYPMTAIFKSFRDLTFLTKRTNKRLHYKVDFHPCLTDDFWSDPKDVQSTDVERLQTQVEGYERPSS